ncbi:MAG: hypothetical protein M1813_009170 [Trichoglossum hirsutum]|nr:MAG: hypothetical protein M1813_009170 [Trichoglossum hirsutum]
MRKESSKFMLSLSATLLDSASDKRVDGSETKELKGAFKKKWKLSETGDDDGRKKPRLLKAVFNDTKNVQEPQDKGRTFLLIQDDDVEVVQNPYPMVFTYPVCLICIGNEQLSYTERICPFKWKYTLQKHLNTHVQQRVFDTEFECKHAYCSERVLGIRRFKNHAARVHRVFY